MRRLWLFVLIVVIAGFLPAASVAEEAPRMSTGDLKAMLGSADLVVLDVRGRWDWRDAGEKIAGAVRVEPEAAAQWVDEHAKGKVIVLYCA